MQFGLKLFGFLGVNLSLTMAALGSQESAGLPTPPFQVTRQVKGLDEPPAGSGSGPQKQVSGPVGPAVRQVSGALAGRIIFMNGGHGWAWKDTTWALGRPLLQGMNEDYGNVDQMTLFAYYCFNAGATVVPMRPVGNQTNEVVLDNTSASVVWTGAWTDSSSAVYFGSAGATPYRFATAGDTETATASYVPTIPRRGFYPVYTWALNGANRINQLYRILHAGGEALVRVPHYLVGNGWVYLGTYFFEQGHNPARGAVVVGNLNDKDRASGVVIADAIRFGNGMGDADRGGGVSTYPREEEASRYWIQRSLGQGQSVSIYDVSGLSDDSDNVGAPIRMAVEMNREEEGNMFKRLYVSFHSNAGGSRGVLGLYNNPALSTNVAKNSNTPNQLRLAQLLGAEVNNDLTSTPSSLLETAWYNRGTSVTFARSDYAFGEINNNIISNEFDATIVEVAFHDDASDAKLMRDPKVRNWVARACYQGVIRYMNQFDGGSLVFLPEPPVNVRVVATNGSALLAWAAPVAQAGSGTATSYVVYASTNGYGFGPLMEVTNTFAVVSCVEPGTAVYFRVSAVNAGGESMPSETVGCRPPLQTGSSRILYVNGFSRFERGLNLRQTPLAGAYRPPGHDANSGTIDRVLPRQVNAFDYVVPHGQAIAAASLMPFDSCQVQAVTNGLVQLTNYQIVIWGAGNQSTADRTFNAVAQQRVAEFRANCGHLMVSGAEVAWDLGRATGPSASDRTFLSNQLHASLGSDANDDAGVYTFTAANVPPLSGASAGAFDDGSRGLYWVGYPDALIPAGTGAVSALSYQGYSGGAAAIAYDGSAGGGRVVYFGFPFETITSDAVRKDYMRRILGWFGRVPALAGIAITPEGNVQVEVTGEPGATYSIQSSSDLLTWAGLGSVTISGDSGTFQDKPPTDERRFYRVVSTGL